MDERTIDDPICEECGSAALIQYEPGVWLCAECCAAQAVQDDECSARQERMFGR
jgi:ribosomal protein L37AE/L43A